MFVMVIPAGLDALAKQKRAERGEPEGKPCQCTCSPSLCLQLT